MLTVLPHSQKSSTASLCKAERGHLATFPLQGKDSVQDFHELFGWTQLLLVVRAHQEPHVVLSVKSHCVV